MKRSRTSGGDESNEFAWRTIIEERRASGMTISAYCEQRGISESSYYQWNRRLKDGGGAAAVARRAVGSFVELEPPDARFVASLERKERWDVELRLPGGTVLRVRG